MASLLELVNKLLPFATPGTPLIQDLVHLAVICSLLYFAPQIQEWLQKRKRDESHENQDAANPEQQVNDIDRQPPEEADHRARDENVRAFRNEPEFENARPNDENLRDFHGEQADEAGPANAPDMSAQRNVGAKKAKSLARKDQRRAYHEFQRAQGEAQRARDAEGAAEREAAQAVERERRKAAEAKLEVKKAKERELKRQQEQLEREEESSRRELAISIVRRELTEQRMSNLFEVARRVGGDADDLWVEKLVKASDLLGRGSDGALTMVTSTGWVVNVTKGDMVTVYKKAAQDALETKDGKVGYDQVAKLLEGVLKHTSDV